MSPVACSAADESPCDADHFCHIGASEQATVCCPGKSLDVCSEPRISGTGDAALQRFAYSILTRQCLPFSYTGVQGNGNNFLSKAACEATCSSMNFFLLMGTVKPMYGYSTGDPCMNGDPATAPSGQFVMCSSTSPNVCPAGYWYIYRISTVYLVHNYRCHIGIDVTASVCCPGGENPCTLPAAVGLGDGTIGRWYFDVHLRRCARFTYSGMGGNANAFMTQQDCQLRCPEFQ